MRFFTTCWIIVLRLFCFFFFSFSFLLGAAWASRISLVMGAYTSGGGEELLSG